MSVDDATLLRAWRSGDQRAASELFERYFPAIHRFFRTKVTDGIEDLVQSTFLACTEKPDRITQANDFRAYLYGIARYQLIAHFKHRRRQAKTTETLPMSSLRDGGPSPSSVLAHQREVQLLLRAMRGLPLDFQIALELHYWESFSAHEIARVLSVPPGTVKSRLHRAKTLLREALHAMMVSEQQVGSTVDNIERWVDSLRRTFQAATAADVVASSSHLSSS